jgi:bacillaene synthase trans-acting acyltransferase
MKTVFMFSGQGSHYFQMGRSLFESDPVFRRHLLQLDELAIAAIGTSVVGTLYSPANEVGATFDRTLLTHPAIFMVEYSTAQALIHAGVTPDIVLGTSLGSFVAATLAGVLSPQEALDAVIQHARTLEEHCEPGGMIAILADPALYDERFLCATSECAAVNFSSHFVVSATRAECANIQQSLDTRDIAWQRLAVSRAFHSRWIDGARVHFEAFMKSVPLQRPTLPLVCSDRGATLPQVHPSHFWDVTRHPIRFPAAIAALEQKDAYRYLDVGPSGTLATILKYVLPAASRSLVQATLTPYGDDLRNWTMLTGGR